MTARFPSIQRAEPNSLVLGRGGLENNCNAGPRAKINHPWSKDFHAFAGHAAHFSHCARKPAFIKCRQVHTPSSSFAKHQPCGDVVLVGLIGFRMPVLHGEVSKSCFKRTWCPDAQQCQKPFTHGLSTGATLQDIPRDKFRDRELG